MQLTRSPSHAEWVAAGAGAGAGFARQGWSQGGLTLGVSLSHSVGDQYALGRFVQAWAEEHAALCGGGVSAERIQWDKPPSLARRGEIAT